VAFLALSILYFSDYFIFFNIENCWFKIKFFIKITRITANGQFDNFQIFYNEPSLCVLSLNNMDSVRLTLIIKLL